MTKLECRQVWTGGTMKTYPKMDVYAQTSLVKTSQRMSPS